MTILLTGFEPFGAHAVNPSRDIVEAVAGAQDNPYQLVTRILPVEYDTAGEAILDLIASHQPRAVLMLGLAESAARPRLERVALNIDEAELADNAGVTRRGETIRKRAPLAMKTGLDLPALQSFLAAEGHAVDISNHAGAYICNHIYFEALHRIAEMEAPTRCLFVHVPLHPTEPDAFQANLRGMIQMTNDILKVLANPGAM